MSSSSEREFLQLAGTYLKCRWCVMGNVIEGDRSDFEGSLLGMVDYRWELRDFVKKWKLNPNHSERHKAAQ